MTGPPTPTSPTSPRTSSGIASQLWRYTALDRSRAHQRGQLAATSAADVRASLRRIGLQVIDVRPARGARVHRRWIGPARAWGAVCEEWRRWWHARLRNSRTSHRAEFYDSMATMLASGLPMLESIQTLAESNSGGRSRSEASMLAEVRERLRDGDSLAQALQSQPGWFGAIDIAMIEAGQHGGNLGSILADLAQRQERSNELSHRLWGALAYPLLVMLVGLGVVVFLSVKTLPDLTKILLDAHIPVPALTRRVMLLGQALATNWLWIIAGFLIAWLVTMVLPRLAGTLSIAAPSWLTAVTSRLQPPRVLRRMRVGALVGGLAELLRSGVPMVEALRVMAPAQQSHRLRTVLVRAAERLEHGDELSAALEDERWFDGEMRRLLDIGQASGDLEEMLMRIGQRYERRARRLIDRLTALLEPAVLLVLATMVGTVVMAAILPLLALQEIIR